MKVSARQVLLLLLVSGWYTVATGQEEKGSTKSEKNNPESAVESKAAAERAFDAVIEEDISEDEPSLVYRPRGTGQTTGHIATITVTNTGTTSVDLMDTGQPGMAALAFVDVQNGSASSVFGSGGKYENGLIDLECSMAYIPSGKKYQDYVATAANWPPGITQTSEEPDQHGQTPIMGIEPGESVLIPVDGYCANIRQPPVPSGSETPPVSDWVSSADATFPTADQIDDMGIIVTEAPPGEGPYIANIPPETGVSDDQTIVMSINPQLSPYLSEWEVNSARSAFLFDALSRIRITAEVLQDQDVVRTPYTSKSPDMQDQELETLIQQTFWLYTSILRGDNYTKVEFADKMTEQYESNTGNKIKNAPPETKDRLDSGVDDFWGSFELVGASAKVLKSDKDSVLEGGLPPGTREKLEKEFESTDLSGVKTHTDGGSEAADEMGAGGYAEGNEPAFSDEPGDEVIADEVVHAEQEHKGVAQSDLTREQKETYEEYADKLRNEKVNHREACEALGVDPESELGAAFKALYAIEKDSE